jgi:hypothetical protein
LADWVWGSFHPGHRRAEAKHSAQLDRELMRRLDASHDGRISFDEFLGWYARVCHEIEAFRRRRRRALRAEPT